MQLNISKLLNWPQKTWQSQHIAAQLTRWVMTLSMSLVAVHHCQPLLDVMADQAMAAGCHQHDVIDPHHAMDSDSGMHHHHHH